MPWGIKKRERKYSIADCASPRGGGKCHWGSITVITATNSFRTHLFIVNAISRTSQHQRAKALWNASFRHPNNQILNQDSIPQGVCNRFVTTGSCPYGNSCKYYHPKQNPQSMNMQGIAVTSFTNTPPPHFIRSQPVGGSSLPDDMVRDSMGVTWGNLPPSLRPPPEGGYSYLPFVDWG